MRIRTMLSTAAALVAGLVVAGCGPTSPTGGGSSGSKSDGSAANKNDTFTVKADGNPTIKQGETKAVKLTLDRGKDFKDSVNLKVGELPKGLKAELAKATVAASEPADVVLNVTADKDAAIAEHVIKVMATPGTGKETAVDVKVKVEAAK